MSYSYSISERKTLKGTVYDARFRVLNGNGIEVQKKLCGFPTKAKAKKAAVEFLSSYVPPKIIEIENGHNIKYDYALSAHLAYEKSQVKESTYYDKLNVFNLFITPYFSGKYLLALNKQLLLNWQDTMWSMEKAPGEYYAQAYLEKIRGYLSRFLAFCEERYETTNYLTQISRPKRRKVKKEMLIYEITEFNQFIAVVDDIFWKTLFMFLFYTGVRQGECQALTDADYKGTSIKIDKSLTKKTIDGSPYKITDTKNYKNREVPLPKILQKQMVEYIDWKHRNNINSDFLFGGSKPIPEKTIRHKFDKYTDLSKVKRIRVHDFRHSYVSLCAHLGATTLVIAHLIGDTPEQVLKTYAHLWQDDKQKVIDLIDLSFN